MILSIDDIGNKTRMVTPSITISRLNIDLRSLHLREIISYTTYGVDFLLKNVWIILLPF